MVLLRTFLAIVLLTLPAFGTREIIIGARNTNGAQQCFTIYWWFPITSGAASQAAGSAYTGTVNPVTTPENTAIQNGTIYEEVTTECFPVGTSNATMESTFQTKWTVRNTQINGVGTNVFIGHYFDSSTGWQ